jgi:type III restriction enzyme
MHPDFLFWHDDGDGEYVMDIVDPHNHSLADTSAKWAALSKYARDHPDRVRRCLAVAQIEGVMRALDLTKDGIDERIAAATNQNLIEAIFAAEGMAYP